MRVRWANPKLTPYHEGGLFVGRSLNGSEVGLETDRHALTCAGARSGKGAGVIIPNLKRWPHSALVIDPKGEAAEETAEERQRRFGMASYVLDPFRTCDVPESLRARFNPLDDIDLNSRTARSDIRELAESLVMRHDPQGGHWDGGGKKVLAGLIAYILTSAPPEARNLATVRSAIITLKKRGPAAERLWNELSAGNAFGGLPEDAAAALAVPKESEHFLSVADENTDWLRDESMAEMMGSSTFRLSDLKAGRCTIYLVLPPDMLKEHGRFLRLFVSCAINGMAKGGRKNKNRCLFLLDEFFSLGYIEKIAITAGLMPGYGVHLWPILQDFGQLEKLYGREGAQTFVGSADLLQFFAVSDSLTADLVSKRLGTIDISQYEKPPEKPQFRRGDLIIEEVATRLAVKTASRLLIGSERAERLGRYVSNEHVARQVEAEHLKHQNELMRFQHQMRDVGKPRMTPDEIVYETRKPDNEPVARRQIAFIKGEPFFLRLAPYFIPVDSQHQDDSEDIPIWFIALFVFVPAILISLIPYYFGVLVFFGPLIAVISIVIFIGLVIESTRSKDAAKPSGQ